MTSRERTPTIAPEGPPLGEVSEVRFSKVTVTHDLRVPMRDGVDLALDLIQSESDEPMPVVLVRTPYDKVLDRHLGRDRYEGLVRRGYVVAINDCRGRFNSDGEFFPLVDEQSDGYDVVQWIASQDWCNGNIGMIGASYDAWTQWYAASGAPPNLKAIVPIAAPPPSAWRNEPIQNGVLRTCFAEWMVGMGRRSWQSSDWVSEAYLKHRDYFETLPFSELADRARVSSKWWEEYMRHPNYDDFWRAAEYGPHSQIRVPALNISGWWDLNFPGSPENFEGMRRFGATKAARDGAKLIIGPWAHRANHSQILSGVDFGPNALIDLDRYILRFFDRWLKGIENGIETEPAVYAFSVNTGNWRAASEWPLPETEYVPFYFHSSGHANSLLGNGVLSKCEPIDGDAEADAYDYDPTSVHRTLWRLDEGPVDDRLATARNDVLCYTSEYLDEPLEVMGWVTCRLYAASSAPDTDWHVRLVDVHPDGVARFLCHGVMRARFRKSLEQPELLQPGQPTLFEFTMDAVGIRFLAGHRIRVEVASAWFTQFVRNLNTGAPNPYEENDPVIARQQVFHRPNLASRVILPVVPLMRQNPMSDINTGKKSMNRSGLSE
jgi:uncharacterized protein